MCKRRLQVNLSFDHTTPRDGIQIGLLKTPYSEQHTEEGTMIDSIMPIDTIFAINIPKIGNILSFMQPLRIIGLFQQSGLINLK